MKLSQIDRFFADGAEELMQRYGSLSSKEKLGAQRKIAHYIFTEAKMYFSDARITPLLDSFIGEGYESGIYHDFVRDKHNGYAIVSGGKEPLRMNYEFNSSWRLARERSRTLWEVVTRKIINDSDFILVECRPAGINTRNRDSKLRKACERVVGFTGQALNFNYER